MVWLSMTETMPGVSRTGDGRRVAETVTEFRKVGESSAEGVAPSSGLACASEVAAWLSAVQCVVGWSSGVRPRACVPCRSGACDAHGALTCVRRVGVSDRGAVRLPGRARDGVSELVREREAIFLTTLESDIQVLDPADTRLVPVRVARDWVETPRSLPRHLGEGAVFQPCCLHRERRPEDSPARKGASATSTRSSTSTWSGSRTP